MKTKLPPAAKFPIGTAVFAAYGQPAKIVQTEVHGTWWDKEKKLWLYFLACENTAESWYTETQLFKNKEEVFEDMCSEL